MSALEAYTAALSIAVDPVAFARRCGISPDPWQLEALRSTSPRIMFCCARRTGKSTVAAVRALRTALVEDDITVLIVSPSERQSGEMAREVHRLYRKLGRPVPADSETALRLELANGSRVLALPAAETRIRGFGARLIVVDEAAQVPDSLFWSVKPALAVNEPEGQLILASTPFGTSGFFYEAWHSGEGYERWKVPATECPRISPEFLAEEKRERPAWWFSQEYECEFREDAGAAVFSREIVERSVDEGVEEWTDTGPPTSV